MSAPEGDVAAAVERLRWYIEGRLFNENARQIARVDLALLNENLAATTSRAESAERGKRDLIEARRFIGIEPAEGPIVSMSEAQFLQFEQAGQEAEAEVQEYRRQVAVAFGYDGPLGPALFSIVEAVKQERDKTRQFRWPAVCNVESHEGLLWCLDQIGDALEALDKEHPGSRATTPPMMWPEWLACVLAQRETGLRTRAEAAERMVKDDDSVYHAFLAEQQRAEAAERTAATLRNEQQVLWREWEERRDEMIRVHEAEMAALRERMDTAELALADRDRVIEAAFVRIADLEGKEIS